MLAKRAKPFPDPGGKLLGLVFMLLNRRFRDADLFDKESTRTVLLLGFENTCKIHCFSFRLSRYPE